MQITGMWPYWLDGRSPATVRNTFEMSSMFLLTGELAMHCCHIRSSSGYGDFSRFGQDCVVRTMSVSASEMLCW